METEKELSTNELETINGGGTIREDINSVIDLANGWLADHEIPIKIPHI